MGQKMSATDDLAHAIKKIRLTNAITDYANDRSHGDVSHVVDFSCPSSPCRKAASGQYNVSVDALHAPFENDSATSSIDMAAGVVTMGSAERNINTNSESVSPVLNVNIDVGVDSGPDDYARSSPLFIESMDNHHEREFCDTFSNDELLDFLRACENKNHEMSSAIENAVEEDKVLRWVDNESTEQTFVSVETVEPSDEELIIHLKKIYHSDTFMR